MSNSNTDNIINTLIDPKNNRNLPSNINNEIVDQLIQKDLEWNDNSSDAYIPQENFRSSSMLMNDPMNYSNKSNAENDNSENLVLNYSSASTLYSISFQNTDRCRLALGTLEKNLSNRIEIVEMEKEKEKLTCVSTQNHEYPSTKLMWNPSKVDSDILAASSDVIRLYNFDEETKELSFKLALNNKKSKYCAPLTSFDWNRENNALLGTASIDTTCTIWDLNKNTIRTQLIAHDKEVFDIAFSHNENIFISTGADGSIRLFDLRSLDHSTIIYETKDQTPITKVAWNMQNSSFISALAMDKETVYIIDSRVAMVSLVELKSHTAPVTAMSWAPQSSSHICSVGEDKFVFIWDIQSQLENNSGQNYLSYKAPTGIYNVSWCNTLPEWIGITFKNQLQLLRV